MQAYPHLDITNIVEYHHRVVVDDWCKEEGSPCKWQHTVQPYTCIGTPSLPSIISGDRCHGQHNGTVCREQVINMRPDV